MEPAQIYRDAYKSYWRDTFFTASTRFSSAGDIAHLKREDLQAIRHLEISKRSVVCSTGVRLSSTSLVSNRGIWKTTRRLDTNRGRTLILGEQWTVFSGDADNVEMTSWKDEAMAEQQCPAPDSRQLPMFVQIEQLLDGRHP